MTNYPFQKAALHAAMACLTILLIFTPIHTGRAESSTLIDSLDYFEVMDPVFEFDTLVIDWHGTRWVHSKGTLQWLTPVRGQPTGALICGKGNFYFTPKLKPERDILERAIGDPEIETPYNDLVLCFTPEVGQELISNFELRESTSRKSCTGKLSRAYDEWHDLSNTAIAPKIARAFFNDNPAPVLYGRIISKKYGDLIYSYDGQNAEPINLINLAGHFDYLQLLSSFHPKSESNYTLPIWNDSADVAISKYTMTVTIREQSGMEINGTLSLRALRPGTRLVKLRLHPRMEILSLTDEEGNPIEVWRKKHHANWDHEVYLLALEPLPVEGETQWNFEIKGKALERHYGHFYLDSDLNWYPRSGYLRKSDFDVTYEYPRYYDLVGIGRKVDETEEKGTIRARWISEKGAVGMSFSIGDFKARKVENQGLPTITLCQTNVASPELKHYLQSQGIAIGSGGKQVADEVVAALQFFTQLYGPCPVEHIYVTEILGGHGQGLLGFIQMSWLTFALHDDWGINRSFRAHETAHQWWGENMLFESYHDQWLSEGFAEYSAWWYLQQIEGNKLFFKRIDKARDNILDARNYLFGKGPPAASLWLGWRASTSETRGDYFRLTYEKGAWILHMLRNLLIDFRTMNEDRFRTMMRAFYQRYQGRRVNTEDFRKTVEEVTGESFKWFFDQWVYGAGIPTYRWNYTQEEREKYWKVTLQVRQEGVPTDFHMPVPVTVEFKDGSHATVRLDIRGDQEFYDLPPIASKPVKILFNDFHSVLCKAVRK